MSYVTNPYFMAMASQINRTSTSNIQRTSLRSSVDRSAVDCVALVAAHHMLPSSLLFCTSMSNNHCQHDGTMRFQQQQRQRRKIKTVLFSNAVLAVFTGCLLTCDLATSFQTKNYHPSIRSSSGGHHALFLPTKQQLRNSKTTNDEQQKERPKQENNASSLKFERPLLQEGYPPAVMEYEADTISMKPMLLYLPGFDGTWLAPFLQLPELSTEFDVRCLSIEMSDRSTFDDLRNTVIEYLMEELTVTNIQNDEENATTDKETQNQQTEPKSKTVRQQQQQDSKTLTTSSSPNISPFMNLWNKNKPSNIKGKSVNPRSKVVLSNRPVYIMGESFGGILASEVVLSLLEDDPNGISKNLKGLTLVNAATCFDRSKLALEGPGIAKVPMLLYPLALIRLLPLFTDEYSLPQLLLILQSKALPSVIDSEEREAYMGRIAFSLPQKLKFMPQETLAWRLTEWLEVGCSLMDSTKLDRFQNFPNLPVLIVAGEKDKTLPSIAEAERLCSILPNSVIHVVEGAGHASTCGSRVDLTALMRDCFPELLQPKNSGRPSLDWMMRLRGTNANNDTTTKKEEENTSDRRRTAMKPAAAKGENVYFGLEPRYNGKEEGLSPLLYWSKKLYKRWKPSNN